MHLIFSITSRFISTLIFLILLTMHPVPPLNAADYVLGPGDVLKITVYDNDDLETITRISDDGNIIMPLLGQVNIDEQTVSQASGHLANLLADGYIVNPQVSIFVQEFRSKKAIVLGGVNRPGIIEMSGPITFLELISKAGGLASNYGEAATVKRKNSGSESVILVNIKSLVDGGDLSQNILMRDGDTIFISRSGMCYVTGEVKSQNAYKCGNDITVLKLITVAGGFTGRASKTSIRVVRLVNGEKTIYENVEMDMIVQPDDVIIVPESFF